MSALGYTAGWATNTLLVREPKQTTAMVSWSSTKDGVTQEVVVSMVREDGQKMTSRLARDEALSLGAELITAAEGRPTR